MSNQTKPLDNPKVNIDFNLNMQVSELRAIIRDAIGRFHPHEIDQMDKETLASCINLGQAIDDLGTVTDRHLKEWMG